METNRPLVEKEKTLVKQRFTRALRSYDEHAAAQQQINIHLGRLFTGWLHGKPYPSSCEPGLSSGENGRFRMERAVSSMKPVSCFRETGVVPRILEIGCGTGHFTRTLLKICRQEGYTSCEWVVNDLCDECRQPVSGILSGQLWSYLPGDAEQLEFPGTFDMVASASVVQWFARPSVFMEKMARLLRPGGIFLFNTFGPRNLLEIKELTGQGLVYPTIEEIKGWFPSSLQILSVEEEEIMLRFPTPLHVLRHLKYTGVTATGTTVWTRGKQERFCREYEARYSNNKEVVLTYQPVYALVIAELNYKQ